ncbi:hypothetical protein ABMA28_006593 [Loxostege sticticalis]|uniref:Protein KRI1 homolog n=1 Tax=Loxostege sticticalis TaxID=481309 RepID=A0ABD0SLR2_LOXSC
MSKKKLFEDDSEEDIAIKTENEYAKKYDTWRKKEEIYKLEQKYGPDALNSDASGSDSEDESDAPPEVSEEVEEQFLKTLALLKTKDPRIYDPNYKCFDKDEEKKPEETSKPKTLTFDDSDDDDDDGGDIFKIEKKAEIDDTPKDSSGSPKKNKKEKKIKDYLTGKAEHIDEEVEKDLAPLKALWSDPKLSEGEAFLRDYILNKRYLEDGADAGEAAEKLRDDEALEADEEIVEEQSRFERAYNFRFEEPDDEYLKRFPRTVSSTRPKDDRRARKRAEVRERKEKEKARKMEEIGRLKALKLKDIQEKIAKIKEVTGNEDLAFKEEDIEGDFDPEEHDRRMRALFDEEYYGEADDQKPVFPDLDEELEIENWDKYEEEAGQPQEDDGPHCEDEEFNMDADYDPKQPRAGLLEEIQKTLGKKRRNRKRKSKLAEILTVEKPKFIPEADKTYDQYMEEYYKLDCEDVIGGDLPTRFKYREVVPNDYGLTVEEILLADDKELTQWVPLKKIVRHRPEHVERGEVKSYAQRAADAALKKKLLPSLFRDLPEEPELVVPVEEGSKKKKNKEKTTEDTDTVKENNELNDGRDAEVNSDVEELKNEVNEKKKKKKGAIEGSLEASTSQKDLSTTYNEIDEENATKKVKSKKKKNTHRVEGNTEASTSQEDSSTTHNEIDEGNTTKEVKSKKKKKKLKVNGVAENSDKNINATEISNDQKDINSEERKTSKKNKKKKANEFIVESVTNQGPSKDTSQENKEINNSKANNNKPTPDKNLKRKLEETSSEIPRKKNKNKGVDSNIAKNSNKKTSKQKDKFKNKNKFKSKQSNDKSNDNPLAKLSDERLKAYGLNPKKYRSFLKYKKF